MSVAESIQEKFSAGLVYGDPVESNGTVVLPAARVRGGGGGGAEEGGGEGGGFGLSAMPSGAWIVDGDGAKWKPAIDVGLFVAGGYLVAIVYFYFRWRIERARAKYRPS